MVFVDQKVASLLVDRNIRGVQEIIGIDNEMETLIAQTECPSQLPTIKEKETFTIPYTSGTTGKPKGVLVPHRSRALTLYGMADAYGCFSSDDRFLSIVIPQQVQQPFQLSAFHIGMGSACVSCSANKE